MIENGNYTSFDDRIGVWKAVFAMWKSNPIIGVSISLFQDTLTKIATSGEVSPFISSSCIPWLTYS